MKQGQRIFNCNHGVQILTFKPSIETGHRISIQYGNESKYNGLTARLRYNFNILHFNLEVKDSKYRFEFVHFSRTKIFSEATWINLIEFLNKEFDVII